MLSYYLYSGDEEHFLYILFSDSAGHGSGSSVAIRKQESGCTGPTVDLRNENPECRSWQLLVCVETPTSLPVLKSRPQVPRDDGLVG